MNVGMMEFHCLLQYVNVANQVGWWGRRWEVWQCVMIGMMVEVYNGMIFGGFEDSQFQLHHSEKQNTAPHQKTESNLFYYDVVLSYYY